MDRKEFLGLLGLGAGAVLTGCLAGCKKDDDGPKSPTPATVDFTIDLTDPTYSSLTQNGKYVFKDGVIIARTTAGDLVAVQQFCSHEGVQLRYLTSTGTFYCSEHDAEFSTVGAVVQQPTEGSAKALKTYTVTVTGTSVRVNG